MTTKEQKSIDAIYKLLSDIRKENDDYKKQLDVRVTAIDIRVREKHMPVNLESDILHSIQDSIGKVLHDVLTVYDSPLKKLVVNVINNHAAQIEKAFDQVVSNEIDIANFSDSIKQEFIKKIAKSILSGIDGNIDKTVNVMKQDSVFRAKLTLVVNNLIDEWKGDRK